MNKQLLSCCLVLFLAFLLEITCLGASPSLPPSVADSLHEIDVLRIENQESSAKIWHLLKKSDTTDVVVLDIDYRELTSAQLSVLKRWASIGHGIWITTINAHRELVEAFGFQLEEEGKTGWQVCQTVDPHPLLTDVEKVSLFHPVLTFTGGYDYPLLNLTVHGKPQIVAALRSHGQGVILAVPSFDEDKYDGRRFTVNIQEFGGGYPVPPSIITNPVSRGPIGKTDRVILNNRQVISGSISSRTFTFSTKYGQIAFPRPEIAFIHQTEDTDTITLINGDRLSGTLLEGSLDIELINGEMKSIDLPEVSAIYFLSGDEAME